MMSQFEEWFQLQSFYLNLRFIHGERLFIFDAQDGYVVQAVQIAWMTWQEQQKRIDQLEMAFKQLIEMSNKSISCEYDLFDKGWNQCEKQTIENIYRLTGLDVEQALKCDEPKEEPQACDHTMVEKTQFGDLHRTFECIFCDHKTTEAWVTTHE